MNREPHLLPHRLAALTVGLVLVASSAARAQSLPRSEESLPLAEAVRDRIPLDDASPEELLAGAMSQFNFFFPAGVATPVTGRAQLDSLVATTVLLEEGIRRGTASYEHAHALFECYAIMYATGRSGAVAQSLERQLESSQGAGDETREMVDIYVRTLENFEEFGLASARTLGELLIQVRPERTDVAYTLASIAEEQGELAEAVRLYRLGTQDERYPERLLALGELLATSESAEEGEVVELATAMAPSLQDEVGPMEERAALRRQIRGLQERVANGRASDDERFELARLYRQTGRLIDALEIYESIDDWSDAPADEIVDYAVAAMEANLPGKMQELMDATRDRANPTPRLLQLRLASESLSVVRAAMASPTGIQVDEFLDSADGERLRQDLEAYEALDPVGADFVRVYLELITALVELRRTGGLEEDRAADIRQAVQDLREQRPDDRSAYRFALMLALYERNRDHLLDALNDYRRFCDGHDCLPEWRRTASLVLLQSAGNEGDASVVEEVDDILDDWPESARDVTFQLVRGTAALMRAELGGGGSGRSRQREQAREAFLAALSDRQAPGADTQATAADYAAIYNNLAFLAIEDRQPAVAKLYLEAARRFLPNQPVVLMNLGVALAAGRDYVDAFVTFGLGATEAMADSMLSFQLMRWAGHLYQLADRSDEAADAYRRALTLYETGADWTSTVDDGVFPGGPVEWGLLYDEDAEGLIVTLDLASPPMFFVPAPISVMEMSAAAEE